MLKKPSPEQTAFEMVTLDGLVPKDHLLRKIDAVIDFSFIHDRVEGLYCPDNGRPALDPTLMFKALFIGYLFGIRSERQLMREIEVNVAYRWFLRMKLTDRVFDASTLSQNRRCRFNNTDVAQDIFDHIAEQAIRHGLVDGSVLYTDSAHLNANANKGKYDLQMVAKSRSDYWADLDRAIEAERARHGQKPLKEKAWCARASRRASSTSITARLMAVMRKETVERSFADAKQLHGHRYARFRSLTRVACQCLLAAAAQNIKKIALALTKAPKPGLA